MLDTHGRKFVQPSIDKTADQFLKWQLSANQVTIGAFIIGCSAGFIYFFGHPYLSIFLLWISGYLDAVDGTMARKTKPSPFGTVMDVTFDRVVEISLLLGISFLHPEVMWATLLLSASIIISMTIFLTVGALTEKEGMKSFYYQAGLAERTEGFILFSIMLAFPSILLWVTLLFVVIELFTGIQRFIEAKKILT